MGTYKKKRNKPETGKKRYKDASVENIPVMRASKPDAEPPPLDMG